MNPINISIVRPGEIYRGPQPYTPAQWQYISNQDIHTILKLNFEEEGTDVGADALNMAVIKVPMQPKDIWGAIGRPDLMDMMRAVDVLGAIKQIYVHCTHGHDRTGLVIGGWRVKYCGWSIDAAYQEMREYGFHPELLDLLWTWQQFKEMQESK